MARYIQTTRGALTVGQTKAAVKEILNGEPFGLMSDPDKARFVVSVLRWHPHRKEKFHGGIDGIEIRPNPMYRHLRGFWLHRKDGTITDISYLEAISPSTDKSNLLQTMRIAIDGWMLKRKQELWDAGGIDAVTGEEIDSFTECDLDHYDPEFKVLAENWLSSLDSVPAIKSGDNLIGSKFVDAAVEKAWYEYHAVNAKVQLVSRETHKRLTRERR